MHITIEVNNRKIKAVKGETILSALNSAGIIIPTLCRLKELSPTGACRICVVEVEGRERLVTACSQPVEEWMKISTHSPRVISARKTIVELLLASHPDDCLYCVRNLECELQRLAEELNIRERRIRGERIKMRIDQSNPSVVRELSKCILCGRCVRVCEEIITATSLDFVNRGEKIHIAPAMDRDFNFSSCINCAQCVQVCPTGALHERHNLQEVTEAIDRPEILTAVQYSPLVPWAIAESLGVKYTRDFDMKLNTVLRKIGFKKVFKTGFGSDILIQMLAGDLMNKKNEDPLIVSACPSWDKYVEEFMPEWIPWLSGMKCQQQIAGDIIRRGEEQHGESRSGQLFSVSITPCAAMKYEARRESNMPGGISDVDTVLTVRELARLIKVYGIDTASVDGEMPDEPMTSHSSSAAMAEMTGGITEGVIREIFAIHQAGEPEKTLIKKIRSGRSFRDITFSLADREFRVAIVDGLASVKTLKHEMSKGARYDLVEVMVCKGGCVAGGGLLPSRDNDLLRGREKYLSSFDEVEMVRLSSKSTASYYLEGMKKGDGVLSGSGPFRTFFIKRDVLT